MRSWFPLAKLHLISSVCTSLLQMGKGVPVTINSVATAADSYMKTAGISS